MHMASDSNAGCTVRKNQVQSRMHIQQKARAALAVGATLELQVQFVKQ